jgi:hypothetical protein
MARIVVTTFGSADDLNPFLALELALFQRTCCAFRGRRQSPPCGVTTKSSSLTEMDGGANYASYDLLRKIDSTICNSAHFVVTTANLRLTP